MLQVCYRSEGPQASCTEGFSAQDYQNDYGSDFFDFQFSKYVLDCIAQQEWQVQLSNPHELTNTDASCLSS